MKNMTCFWLEYDLSYLMAELFLLADSTHTPLLVGLPSDWVSYLAGVNSALVKTGTHLGFVGQRPLTQLLIALKFP